MEKLRRTYGERSDSMPIRARTLAIVLTLAAVAALILVVAVYAGGGSGGGY